MAFDPNQHMMKLNGKDYLQVMWRLVWFREDHPDWCIEPTPLEYDAEHAIFKATIYDETGAAKVTGHGSESKRDFGDFFEKAETKAVGRALAMLGYGTQFTATELDEGERIVDSPVDRAPRGTTEAAQAAGREKLDRINAQMPAPMQSTSEPITGPQPATDGQKQIIREKATDEEYLRIMQKYGAELERLSMSGAVKVIREIEKRIEEAS